MNVKSFKRRLGNWFEFEFVYIKHDDKDDNNDW